MRITLEELKHVINLEKRQPLHWYDFIRIKINSDKLDRRFLVFRTVVENAGDKQKLSWSLKVDELEIVD